MIEQVHGQSAPPSLTQLPLPSDSACGTIPTQYPGLNQPVSPSDMDWPNQSWPTQPASASLPLNCTVGAARSPAFNFVASQFPIPVDDQSNYPDSPTNCDTDYTNPDNHCSQMIVQSTQTTENPSMAPWQPPLPITIVGSGFGYLSGLPAVFPAGTSPSYLTIENNGGSGLHTGWNTSDAGAGCQIYIANWTDSSISLVVNLPEDVHNMDGILLSPLSDFSPLSFLAASPTSGTGCPVAYDTANQLADNLTFTVTNPQSGVSASMPNVPVWPTATTAPF